jgi:hypothetical protein
MADLPGGGERASVLFRASGLPRSICSSPRLLRLRDAFDVARSACSSTL